MQRLASERPSQGEGAQGGHNSAHETAVVTKSRHTEYSSEKRPDKSATQTLINSNTEHSAYPLLSVVRQVFRLLNILREWVTWGIYSADTWSISRLR